MTSRDIMAVLLAGIILAGAGMLAGCEKKQPAPPTGPTAPKTEPNKPVASVAVVEQTMCPVMGGAIDKNIFVEYKGKKVYFCCAQCKGEFEKAPEKYIAKLPQFK